MATARRKSEPAPLQVKEFTLEEIDRGIARLQRRIEEVKALDPKTIQYDDQRIRIAEQNIRSDILEIFGPHSPEYHEHQYHDVSHGPYNMMDGPGEHQRQFAEGHPRTVALLEGLIARLNERRGEQARSPDARARSAFDGLNLHPRISAVATDLYRDGHYRNAVLDASVALVNYVKEKSRQHDLDGASLMRTVFSVNNTILAFNALADQSDRDEQQGLMHLFEGAVLAFRNPRAHDLDADSPEDAMEYLAFLSLLAKRLDQAKRPGAPAPVR